MNFRRSLSFWATRREQWKQMKFSIDTAPFGYIVCTKGRKWQEQRKGVEDMGRIWLVDDRSTWQVSRIVKYTLIIQSKMLTLGYLLKRNKNICPYKYLSVCSSSILNKWKLDINQISINWWMEKQIVVHWLNKTTLSNEKEDVISTFNNREYTSKYYAKQKKLDKNRLHIMWFCFY